MIPVAYYSWCTIIGLRYSCQSCRRAEWDEEEEEEEEVRGKSIRSGMCEDDDEKRERKGECKTWER